MVKVTLDICEEFYAFARKHVEDLETFSAKDYLNGLLNMALLREIDDFVDLTNIIRPVPLVMSTPGDHRLADRTRFEPKHDLFDEIEQDEGGGWRRKEDEDDQPPAGNGSDMDDDIPF